MVASLLWLHVVAFLSAESALLRKKDVKYNSGLWKPCAAENEELQAGGLVRFGFGEEWVEGNLPRGASCSVSTFGSDPAPGLLKICECAGGKAEKQDIRKDDMGLSWHRCASEGQKCSCDSGTVRFGSVSRWVVTEAGAAKGYETECSVTGFNGLDPSSAKAKECWCMTSPEEHPKVPGVAIVLLSRRAADLKTWLQYHLDYMGVTHVFMDVEDTPHFDDTWKSLSQGIKDRVTVWKTNSTMQNGDERPADDYTTLQARQLVAMRRAKKLSKKLGIEWLLHIDDDELLYAPLHRPVGEILNSVQAGFDQAYIPNVEAIYDSADVKNCFSETKYVNMNRYTFVSYANGKAAVRVTDADAFPAGPHQWRTSQGVEVSSIHLDAEVFGSPIWLVHFESCPFQRWEDKFHELGNTSPEKIKAIPFPYYRESISRFLKCKTGVASESFFSATLRRLTGISLNGIDEECTEPSLKSLWSHWKTRSNPKIRTEDLMPISIPWDKIKASAQ